jgi:hypothetical protein
VSARQQGDDQNLRFEMLYVLVIRGGFYAVKS